MHMLARAPRLVAAVLGVLTTSSILLANSGTQLPLSQYQAGTESTSPALVTNGNFEQPGSPNPNPDPTGWTRTGTVQAGQPLNPPSPASTVGSFAAQGPLGNNVDGQKFTQSLTLAPNTDYVISAYMWNFGQATVGTDLGDLTVAEVVDPTNATNSKTLSLERVASDGGDGAGGYFVHDTFNSSQFPNGAVLEVEGDFGETLAGTRPNIWWQVDNVAITPAAQFAPPRLIPEPASLTLLGAGALLLARRRR
jgi:hypothetical protein